MPIMQVNPVNPFGISTQEGYIGAFTRHQADGAFPNGTRIRKINSEPNDITRDDEVGTILGSVQGPGLGFFYFVEWDNKPKVAVGAMAKKVERIEE